MALYNFPVVDYDLLWVLLMKFGNSVCLETGICEETYSTFLDADTCKNWPFTCSDFIVKEVSPLRITLSL